MNWHACPHRFASSVREMPQSVHKSRGAAGPMGGVKSAVVALRMAMAVDQS
jgi:hypothetical protein